MTIPNRNLLISPVRLIIVMLHKGALNYHVDIILLFFDYPPTSIDFFCSKRGQKWQILDTYPPLLVHVAIECPLI